MYIVAIDFRKYTFYVVMTPRHSFTDLPIETLKNTNRHQTRAA